MPNNYFRFKQFTVLQELCAMKVGTDGVLLGAWADCSGCTTVLDVGTGSGLLALMIAQRSQAQIHAIDIDESACRQAEINARQSPFTDRIKVFQSDYTQYIANCRYDLIISNPPFFSHSLKSPHPERSKARHNDLLPFKDLILKSITLLNENGRFSVIIPFSDWEYFNDIACNGGLKLSRKTIVRPKPDNDPKRILLEYSMEGNGIISEDELTIEYDRHVYSEEYTALTKDFYLQF